MEKEDIKPATCMQCRWVYKKSMLCMFTLVPVDKSEPCENFRKEIEDARERKD